MGSYQGTLKPRNHKALIKNIQQNPLKVRLTESDLRLYLRYATSRNDKVRIKNIINLKKLVDQVPTEPYEKHIDYHGNKTDVDDDNNCLDRLYHLRRVLKAKVEDRLTDINLILQAANGGIGETGKYDAEVLYGDDISDAEVEWINESISDTLGFGHIYNYSGNLISLLTTFENCKGSERKELANSIKESVLGLKNEFRVSENESYIEAPLDLNNMYEDRLREVYEKETSPSNILVTGMQGLDKMLGGGFQSGRVYMLFGVAAAGKSFTMLDIAMQIKKYNTNYVCKDKTKRPAVVVLTMENSVDETISRIYSMLTGRRMKNDSFEEVRNNMMGENGLFIDDSSPVNFIVKYKPNLSVTTDYLYTLYDDVLDLGFEPMIIVQDHIKRIRSVNETRDTRLDLGNIVNEFKAFAVEKDIVVFSDSHLNRDAAKIIDDASRANKQDLARLLGRSNVSESMLMIDNCDVGMIITKDRDSAGLPYMGIMLIRTRTESYLDYFAQPYVPGNPVKLVEDIGANMPSYKATLHDPSMKNNIMSDYDGDYLPVHEDDDLFNTYSPPGTATNPYDSREEFIPQYSSGGMISNTPHPPSPIQIMQQYMVQPQMQQIPITTFNVHGTTMSEAQMMEYFDPGNIRSLNAIFDINTLESMHSPISFCDDEGVIIVDGAGRNNRFEY